MTTTDKNALFTVLPVEESATICGGDGLPETEKDDTINVFTGGAFLSIKIIRLGQIISPEKVNQILQTLQG